MQQRYVAVPVTVWKSDAAEETTHVSSLTAGIREGDGNLREHKSLESPSTAS